LDLKKLIQIERRDNMYFVKSEDDESAEIRYDNSAQIRYNGRCYISWKLVAEISRFFSLDVFNSEEVIVRWVENVLQMKVFSTIIPDSHEEDVLEIPSN
jgi:hypothetical protein